MMEFDSFGSFAMHLIKLAVTEAVIEREMLEHAAVAIEERAKGKIGHDEEPAAGPFAAWDPLAQSTVEEKEYLGYVDRLSPNDSLLRTGKMRDFIEHNVAGHIAHIGSNDDEAVYQEFGTATIPPRSFFGSSAFELAPKIVAETGLAFTAWLAGGKRKIEIG